MFRWGFWVPFDRPVGKTLDWILRQFQGLKFPRIVNNATLWSNMVKWVCAMVKGYDLRKRETDIL